MVNINLYSFNNGLATFVTFAESQKEAELKVVNYLKNKWNYTDEEITEFLEYAIIEVTSDVVEIDCD
jgi:hypothetical protein